MSKAYTLASYKKYEKDILNNESKCLQCNSGLLFVGVSRTLLDGVTSLSGSGKVMGVAEIYCPKCHGEPKLPSYGTPISEDSIIYLK